MKKYIFVFLVTFISLSIYANNTGPTKIQALNNYASFINESIHGMVIVHRLLENYNQELNKYVDLEGYQINNFGNSDLPKNIFDDPDDWFYSISPLEWYQIALDGSSVLPASEATTLNKKMESLKSKILAINQIRFEIDNFIRSNDLTKTENAEKVYTFLEKGVDLYDSFYAIQVEMETQLIKLSRQYGNPDSAYLDIIESFDKCWFSAKNILRSVRDKKDENLPDQISTLSSAYAKMRSIEIGTQPITSLNTAKNVRSWEQALTKLQDIATQSRVLIETAEVPVEYKFYGKFYYYHNAVLTNYINRYGSGFAHEMNKIILDIDIPILLRTEEPHFYQVIYPKKLVSEEIIASSDDIILAVPSKLKNREIIKSTRTIMVDTTIFEINLYDYKIQDGDIVSINFNGDWILENHSLEGSPTKLKVQLNSEGKNYLILHAINEGRNPPNTMAVSYYYKGEKQTITLSSNLAESEMIEIKYDKN